MADVLIRNVSEETLDLLKKRAAKNRRSLQRELLDILVEAGLEARVRSALEVVEEFHRNHPDVRNSGGPDSVELIRETREER